VWKKIFIILFVIFYGLAGVNHYLFPAIYLEVIPEWLGNPTLVNAVAGAVEILIAVLAIFSETRKIAGYGAIAMLLAFIISHVYFIQMGHCAGELCLAPWLGWVRLVVIHPLLIYWAYRVSRS